jgi:nucleoside-diphosphate-sugar epimerase
MRILVTGASGFVGSLLIPRLRDEGHEVRALARDPARVAVEVETVRADAFTGEGLARALAEIEVAYYLIHSMERDLAPARPGAATARFEERDRVAAENFARAAVAAGVRRIVYLGGLLPARTAGDTHAGGSLTARNGVPVSRHLRSRVEVERTLLEAVADSLALRASIVIGARSRSFRLLVRLIERMRALPLPAWRTHRTQPIDQRDVTEMLARAASADVGGRSLDIGGPEVLSYGEMVKRIADAMLVGRAAVGVGANLTPVTARVAAAITREDPQLVLRLMESLNADLLPEDDHAAELLGVELHSFDSAVEHALREWEEIEPLAAR